MAKASTKVEPESKKVESENPEITFVSTKPFLVLTFKSEVVHKGKDIYGNDVFHSEPPKLVQFQAGILRTSDPELIKFIRNNDHYTGKLPQWITETRTPTKAEQTLQSWISQAGVERVVETVMSAQRLQEQQEKNTPVADPIGATVQSGVATPAVPKSKGDTANADSTNGSGS